MRISAAVLRDPTEPFHIEAVELAEPGPGEALVRVSGVGLCHTDLIVRHPPLSALAPAVLGHEGSGVVEAIGAGITRVQVGDHVVISFDSCGWCEACMTGSPTSCVEFAARNMSGRRVDGSTVMFALDGELLAGRWFGQSSFATHTIASDRNLVPIDRDVPLELMGPLGCGFQTGAASIVNGLRLRAGESVAVFGTGAVGLAAVMAARLAGAAEIVAVDVNQSRLELALELGASRIVNGADPELVDLVGRRRGLDVAFDTTGVPEVVTSALLSLKDGGRCGLVGVGGDLNIPLHAIVGRSLTYLIEGKGVPQVFIPRLISLWQQGRFPFDRLIRSYPLSEINQAEKDTADGVTVKAVLIPGS